MNAGELGSARAQTWAMFGQVMLDGPASASSWLDQRPDLQAALGRARQGQALDTLWAAVPPRAGVFLEGAAPGAGSATARALGAMGLDLPQGLEETDHIAALCFALAEVEGRRAAATRASQAQRAEDRARELVRAHLLPWLPAFVVAVQREARPFYAEVVRKLAAFAASYQIPAQSLPERPEDPLDAAEIDGAAVVAWLASPGTSGWWLSDTTLARVADEVALPAPVDLASLVAAASAADTNDPLREALLAELRSWREGYEQMSVLGLPVQAWFMRMAVTGTVVRGLGTRWVVAP